MTETRLISDLTGADAIAVADLATANGAAKSDLSNVLAAIFGAKAFAATGASVARALAARFGAILTPQDFGEGVGSGGDDTAAFLLWAAALGSGAEGYVPAGTYNLDSATLGSTGLVWKSGTKIRGAGEASKVVITGSASCNILTGEDVDGLDIEGVWFYGNNQASGFGVGYAISHDLSVAATASIRGVRVKNSRFDNFKGDYWISTVNYNSTYKILNPRVTDNDFYSYSGNSRGPANLGIPCANVLFNGYAGWIEGVRVERNYSDANWIKSHCILFSKVRKYRVDHNTIDNAGQGEAQPDKGAYGIMIYGSTDTPDAGSARYNIITNPYSIGIYAPQISNLKLGGNEISGQTDTADGTIPKGAIVAAGVSNVEITGGSFAGNFCDIVAQGPLAGGEANISITGIRSSGGSGRASIRVLPQVGVNWSGLTITGCDIKHATKGIVFTASNSEAITDISISGGRIEAPYGIDLNGTDVAGVLLSKCVISGVRIEATNYGVYAYATDGVSVLGNQFEGLMSGAHVYGASATSFFTQGNTHKGQSAGNTYNMAGATGGVWGNNFWDCLLPTAAGATMLGYQRPTFSGYLGLMVQNLNVSDAGGAGKTYTVQGWICTGTTNWDDLRAPDQNNTATA